MFFEPIVTIAFVVCNTWAEYIDEGEAFMIHGLLNQINELFTIHHIALCYECSTCCNRSFTNGQWRLKRTMRSCFCNKTDVRTRGCLTFSQTIYMVIHYYVCHVYITFESMNGMTHTDSERIAITGECDNFKILVSKFNTLRIRKRTAMSCMCTISVEIATDTARTTDTGNYG